MRPPLAEGCQDIGVSNPGGATQMTVDVQESFAVPAATKGTISRSVNDGVHLMLAPSSVGHHKIHFDADAPAYNFLLDITYHIEVIPCDDDDDDD